MYQHYWGLRESPFRGGLDVSQFFSTLNSDEALARLQFLVEERRRIGLLTGTSGIGKSMVLEVFASQLEDAGGNVARLNLRTIEPQEFLWSFSAQCGIHPSLGTSEFVLWRGLSDFLLECRYERKQIVLLLDEAHAATPALSECLLRLAHFDQHPESRLTILLACEGTHQIRLHPRLVELAELAVTLEPWEAVETASYLEFALHQVGSTSTIFTSTAAKRLHDLAGGIPRRIKQLADLALMAGAGLELAQIDSATIDDVCQELGVMPVRSYSPAMSH